MSERSYDTSRKIRKALGFYAEFPNETDLFLNREDDESLRRSYFLDDFDQADFEVLARRVDDLCLAITQGTREIVDRFAEFAENDKWRVDTKCLNPLSRVREKKLDGWRCQFKVFKSGARTGVKESIWIGLSIGNLDGAVRARSWLWCRGANWNLIKEVLGQSEVYSDAWQWPNDTSTLVVAEESILAAYRDGTRIDTLVERLFRPLREISMEQWKALFSINKTQLP